VFGVQSKAMSLSTNGETVQELLVPVQAPKASALSPVYRRAVMCYEPFIGRRLEYALRAAGRKVADENPKLYTLAF